MHEDSERYFSYYPSDIEKDADKVFGALESCISRNFNEESVRDAKMWIVHKLAWAMTLDNGKANKVRAVIEGEADVQKIGEENA